MHPILFKFGFITIYSYGLMIFIAVSVCLYLLLKAAERNKFNKDKIFDLAIVVIFSGIVGARILYILLNLKFYLDNPLEIMMIHHGGLAILGGIAAATLSATIFIKLNNLPLLATFDLIVPYVALGQAIGRIGCLLNGCCYGFVSSFGLYFPVHDAILFPAQVLSSLLLLCIYIFLRIKQERSHQTGMIFASYILSYSLMRFFVEFVRADSPKLFLNLTIFQYFCLVFFALGLIFTYRIKKWKK